MAGQVGIFLSLTNLPLLTSLPSGNFVSKLLSIDIISLSEESLFERSSSFSSANALLINIFSAGNLSGLDSAHGTISIISSLGLSVPFLVLFTNSKNFSVTSDFIFVFGFTPFSSKSFCNSCRVETSSFSGEPKRSSASSIFFRFRSEESDSTEIISKKFPVRAVPSAPLTPDWLRFNIRLKLFMLLFVTMVIYALRTYPNQGEQ